MGYETNTAAAAIRVAARLIGQLNDGPRRNPARTAVLFGRLRALARGLPLTPKFRENLALWPQMWEAGEWKAARYQLVQLVRRLRTVAEEPGVAVPKAPARDAAAAQVQEAAAA